MILPDVNILIYGFRADLPQHAVCRSWLMGVISSDTRFGLSPAVLSAVVRITKRSCLQGTKRNRGGLWLL
jgi:uncharacterized protein